MQCLVSAVLSFCFSGTSQANKNASSQNAGSQHVMQAEAIYTRIYIYLCIDIDIDIY